MPPTGGYIGWTLAVVFFACWWATRRAYREWVDPTTYQAAIDLLERSRENAKERSRKNESERSYWKSRSERLEAQVTEFIGCYQLLLERAEAERVLGTPRTEDDA